MSRSVLPQRSKDCRFFRDAHDSGLKPSGHTTQRVLKEKNQQEWVRKEFHNPLLPQIEAGIAALYKLIKPAHIPKVRGLYRKTPEKPEPEFFASVSKMLPDFMDLQSFIGSRFGVAGNEAETQKTLHFLIRNGLPEVCALSYFFEEDDFHKGNVGVSDGKVVRIDFDMSAYSIVSQSHLRGARAFSGATFPITMGDLSNFPVLSDATPSYWLTTHRMLSASHGYSADDVRIFSELKNDALFCHKSYLTFLKIILTPDDAIKTSLAAHISDPVELEKIQTHFIARKAQLKLQLMHCYKFQVWWKKVSLSELQSIFQELQEGNVLLKEKHHNLRINLREVTALYHDFSREMTKEKIEESLVALAELAKRCRNEIKVAAAVSPSLDIYSTLVGFNDVLLGVYKLFRDRAPVSAEDIADFVLKVNNALTGLKLHCQSQEAVRLLPDALKNNLSDFFTNMEYALNQLQRDRSACAFPGETRVAAASMPPVDFTAAQEYTFIHAPILDPEELVRDTVIWLRKPNNKSMVEDIFKAVCKEYENSTVTVTSQFFSGLYASLPSFSWVATKAAEPPAPAPAIGLSELNAVFLEICAAETSDHLCHVISRLLSETKPWCKIVCEQFVLGLINQFSREFSAKHIVEQLKNNPDFAEYLKAQPNNQVESSKAMEIAALFIAEMRPNAGDSADFRDCVVVDHTSDFHLEEEPKVATPALAA